MPENAITIAGNLADDPELRFTSNGRPVSSFTVAVSRRVKGPGGEWETRSDGFFKCTAWANLAENVVESLTKGARVVVTGRLEKHSWQTNDGDKRSAVEVVADDVGASLTFATVDINRQHDEQTAATAGEEGAPDA